jgi:hypothetical protein
MQTGKTIPNNKPDIITRDNEKLKYMLIQAAISVDRNGVQRAAENILKYKDLKTEIRCMWNVKAKVIPVITGETGTVSKLLRQCPSNIT